MLPNVSGRPWCRFEEAAKNRSAATAAPDEELCFVLVKKNRFNSSARSVLLRLLEWRMSQESGQTGLLEQLVGGEFAF